MEAFQLRIEGNWAHFKKPETNNNPLTHDFITKTAFLGLIGAVLGRDRYEMKQIFPQLSEDLLYGVELLNPVKKESWAFTMRKAVNMFEKAPKQMEFLKKPDYLVSVALCNSRSEEIFREFMFSIENSYARYTPVLGLHNCPANLSFISKGYFSNLQNGDFDAKCFISKSMFHKVKRLSLTDNFRIGFDKIPTYQTNDFWNLPEKYVEIIYPSVNQHISVNGDFYEYQKDGARWWLI